MKLSRLYPIANTVVKIFGILIFAFLTWYAIITSQYIVPLAAGYEYPQVVADSRSKNIFWMLLTMGAVLALDKFDSRIKDGTKKILINILLTVSVIWTSLFSIWWIINADCIPTADPGKLCVAASEFMEGNYSDLKVGGYCASYPQQLGMVFILEVLFRIFGKGNYFAYKVVNAILIPGIVTVGYGIVRNITKRIAPAVLYLIEMCLCFPVMFYTSWVYGEIASIFFYLLSVFLLLKYRQSGKTRYLVLMIPALSICMLTRKNTLILVVAICLAGLVSLLKKFDKRLFIGIVCAVIVPNLAMSGIQVIYSARSGIAPSKGIENASFIAMGLRQEDGRYGWDNNYQPRTEFNEGREGAGIVYRRDMNNRIKLLLDDPAYAVFFFREKQLSQWNEPLYQGLYFGAGSAEDTESLIYKIRTEKYFVMLLHVCDRLQMIIFSGMLFYYIFAVKKESDILEHVIPILIIGGFLFTAVWEAKARYILPYYVVMFPIAAIGYQRCAEYIGSVFAKFYSKSEI